MINRLLIILFIYFLPGNRQIAALGIVKINVPEIIVDAGKSSTIHVKVEVKNGYHIQANKVTDEYLIPTTLKINADKNIMPGEDYCNAFCLCC